MDVAAAANATIEQLPVASGKENKNSAALYDQLVELEAQDGVIFNLDTFECEICFCDIGISDGIMIRNCLHQFCIECVRQLIISYEDADVICPASGCESVLQDREIRALLTQTEFDKYLVKTLRIAESKAANSYHCKRADCDGWCIVEDELNMFTCPQCSSDNCLSCRAIHPGQNCREYQENLVYEGLSDNERTEMYFDDIVKNNLGMRCTKCKIVIMKREGCDALTCSMCKTELCWATKQSRWGPGGHGDTSGGCRCSSIQPCHPQCRNCH